MLRKYLIGARITCSLMAERDNSSDTDRRHQIQRQSKAELLNVAFADKFTRNVRNLGA